MTCLVIYNSDGVDYQLLNDYDVSLEGTDYLLFEVESCGPVQLILMQNETDFQSDLYEVILGKRMIVHFRHARAHTHTH